MSVRPVKALARCHGDAGFLVDLSGDSVLNDEPGAFSVLGKGSITELLLTLVALFVRQGLEMESPMAWNL